MRYIAIAAAVLVSCVPEARTYDPAPRRPASNVSHHVPSAPHAERGWSAKLPAVAAPPICEPGVFTCEDACAVPLADACPDLPEHCGLQCAPGGPPIIDDPCEPLVLVVMSREPMPSCYPTPMLGICNEPTKAYCCTADGADVWVGE